MEPIRAQTPAGRGADRRGLLMITVLLAATSTGCRKWPHPAEPTDTGKKEAPATSQARFATTTNHSYGLLGVTTSNRDVLGKPARIPCMTCHYREPLMEGKAENRQAKAIPGFHGGIELKHGGQACRTCHQVPGFDAFTLASGQPVSYLQVIDLCGQCHARRVAEYRQGIHGGMNGYWDLGQGPRNRNLCIDCHNAHAPAIGPVMPAPRHRPRPGL